MDRWIEIFASLKKNGLRTFLSGFTVALGLFIFITLFGMGNGLKNSFQKEFIRGTSNAITLSPGKTSMAYNGLQANRRIVFKNEDLDFIKENFTTSDILYYTASLFDNVKASYKSEYGSYSITAAYPKTQVLERNELIKGRFLNPIDLNNREKVAVIGRLIEKDLFKNEDALGKFIDLNGINFKIVGTFSDEGGDDEERKIYIPLTTQQQLKSSTQIINRIVLGYNPDVPSVNIIQLGAKIKEKLKKKKNIHPDDNSGIYMRNTAEDQAGSQSFLGIIIFIVGFIGLGTLIAGMMGIFNIMVYSVKERTKELGVRKAIGAPPNSIIKLVLYESIFITLLSGIIGILAGILFLKQIGNTLEDYFIYNPSVDTGLIILALFCLVIAGLVAGLIPSYRASKIKPIEALRDE